MGNNKKTKAALAAVFLLGLTACDRTSSPEGRMSLKVEELQKEMSDSFKKQNAAIADSFGKIREELQKLQKEKR